MRDDSRYDNSKEQDDEDEDENAAYRQPPEEGGTPVDYHTQINKKGIAFFLDPKMKNRDVHIFINNDFVVTVKVGSSGSFKINKKNTIGKMVVDAINMKENVEIRG